LDSGSRTGEFTVPAKPYREQIYHEIRRRIESGEYPPGSQLPITRELATEFGVAAGTVEWATDRLEFQGWIIGQQGKGRFVADNPPNG
jgi:GntR family transcriptional regulator